MPKVSVIIRTKNRPLMLRRALASVVAQDVDGLQLVLVNDGGDKAETEKVLAEAELQNIETVVLHNETSHGRAVALVEGHQKVTGDYYVVLDDDDTLESSFLRRTIDFLDANPDSVAVVTRSWVVHEDEKNGELIEQRREIFASAEVAITLPRLALGNYVPLNSLLIRKNVSDEVGGYNPEYNAMEDWDMILRLANIGPIGFIDEPLALWHHRVNANGDAGNSIFLDSKDHIYYEQIIRDKYVREGGNLGNVLLQAGYAKYVNSRLKDFSEQLSVQTLERASHTEVLREDLHVLVENKFASLEKQIKYGLLGRATRKAIRVGSAVKDNISCALENRKKNSQLAQEAEEIPENRWHDDDYLDVESV